jgi:soluble lytic murein transglycosylase
LRKPLFLRDRHAPALGTPLALLGGMKHGKTSKYANRKSQIQQVLALAALALLGTLPMAPKAFATTAPVPSKTKKLPAGQKKISKKAKEQSEKEQAEWKELFATRLSHAKELLGRAYRQSVASLEEEERQYREFLLSRIQARLPAAYKRQARKIHKAILDESTKHGFDPAFLVAVIDNESSFNPLVRGTSGEIGLMQVLPSTAAWTAKRIGMNWKGKKTLEDPIANIQIGAAYLAHLRSEFDYHGRLYLSAYNMGTRNVRRALERRVMPKDYASRVMQRYLRFYEELRENLAAPAERALAGDEQKKETAQSTQAAPKRSSG